MPAPHPRLVDSHLHLQDPVLSADLDGVLGRARAAGVARLVSNGSCEEDWPQVLDIARRHPDVVPCFGLHPWYVGERSEGWLEELERHLSLVPSGLGETGLDRWRKGLDERAQEDAFQKQLALARRRELPVMIHCLGAWGWLLDVLRQEPPLPAGMLLHAYGGAPELIGELARRGAYFSFAGDVLDERKLRKRESLRAAPLDRVLIETDAPDILLPEGLRSSALRDPRGRARSEPAELREVLRGVSALRGEPEEELAGTLWENAERFFGALLR